MNYRAEFTSTDINAPDGGWDINAYDDRLSYSPKRYPCEQIAIECKDRKKLPPTESFRKTIIKIKKYNLNFPERPPIYKLIIMCSHYVKNETVDKLTQIGRQEHFSVEVWDRNLLEQREKDCLVWDFNYSPFYTLATPTNNGNIVKRFYNIPKSKRFFNRISNKKDICKMLNIYNLVQIVGSTGEGKSALARICAEKTANNFEGILGIDVRNSTSPFDVTLQVINFLDESTPQNKLFNKLRHFPAIIEQAKIVSDLLNQNRYLIILDNFERVLNEIGGFISSDMGWFFRHLLSKPTISCFLITTQKELQYEELNEAKHRIGAISLELIPITELSKWSIAKGIESSGKLKLNRLSTTLQTPLILNLLHKNLPYLSSQEISTLKHTISPKEFIVRIIEKVLNNLTNRSKTILYFIATSLKPLSYENIKKLGFTILETKTLSNFGLVTLDKIEQTIYIHSILSIAVQSYIPPKKVKIINNELAKMFHADSSFTSKFSWSMQHHLQRISLEHYIAAKNYKKACDETLLISTYALGTGDIFYLKRLLSQLIGKCNSNTKNAWLLKVKAHVLDFEGDYDSALDVYEEMLKLSKKAKSLKAVAAAWNGIGTCYRRMRRLEDSRQAYEKSLFIRNKLMDKFELGKIHNNLGVLSILEGNMGDAIKHLGRAIDLRKETNDFLRLSTSLITLAFYFLNIQRTDKALNVFLEALEYKTKIGDYQGEYWCNLGLSWCYILMDDQKRSQKYFMSANETSWLFEDNFMIASSMSVEIVLEHKESKYGNTITRLRKLFNTMNSINVCTHSIEELIDLFRKGDSFSKTELTKKLLSTFISLKK